MKRLGYTEFAAQGGDWGAIITDLMGTRGVSEAARHSFQHAGVFQPDIDKAALSSAPAPSGLSRRRQGRVRALGLRIREGYRLRLSDGIAAAGAVRDCGVSRWHCRLPS